MKFLSLFLLKRVLILVFAILLIVNHSLASGPAAILFRAEEQGKSYLSAGVLDQWMSMQIHLMSHTQASFNGPFIRIYAYSGIVALTSLYPIIKGQSPYSLIISRLNELPRLPDPEKGKKFYGPASLNSALAYINRRMFPMASEANKKKIDSLEEELKKSFYKEVEPATVTYSADYGKKLALIIYHWAESDGYKNDHKNYVPPSGQGKWKPTAPAYAKAVSPYWGQLRTIVPGSIEHTEPLPPPAYDQDTSSIFYKMVEEVYVISKTVTPEQKAIAYFWKDINPGITAPGHWLNILRQVMHKENSSLVMAAYAYALTGIALNDTWISSWKTRYTYNILRPITYIHTVIGDTAWEPIITTPPHPEYPGGHAALSSSVAEVLTELYGEDYAFTDHTYDYLEFRPRNYSSFRAIASEAAISKVYGGIHYRVSVEIGLQQGKDVTQNILSILLKKGPGVMQKVQDKNAFGQ